jgi:serine/threonine protein kinase
MSKHYIFRTRISIEKGIGFTLLQKFCGVFTANHLICLGDFYDFTYCLNVPNNSYSLGLVLVEMAGNCDLPDSGEGWHKLRRADISDVPFEEGVSRELVDLIQSLLNPDPGLRPTVDHLLLHPRLAEVVYGRIYNHQ